MRCCSDVLSSVPFRPSDVLTPHLLLPTFVLHLPYHSCIRSATELLFPAPVITHPLVLSKYRPLKKRRKENRKKMDVCEEGEEEEGVGVSIALPNIACIYDYRRLYFLGVSISILSIPIVGASGERNRLRNIRNTGVRMVPNWDSCPLWEPSGAPSRK